MSGAALILILNCLAGAWLALVIRTIRPVEQFAAASRLHVFRRLDQRSQNLPVRGAGAARGRSDRCPGDGGD